ncbi:MAG: YicC/YloC family endoribonuclease [Thermodesulfobacteriota bacterium]
MEEEGVLRSMTGYGRFQADGRNLRAVVELRSVNSRSLDIGFRLPPGCWSLESSLRKQIQRRCHRGRIEVSVTWEALTKEDEPPVELRLGRAKAIKGALESLKEELGLPGEVDLALLASFRDLWDIREHPVEEEAQALGAALEGALRELEAMKRAEGKAIQEDLRTRANWIRTRLKEAEERAPVALENHLARWGERIRTLAREHDLDPARMEQEAALRVDRLDVQEEMVRLRIHLERLLEVMEEEPPVGKKLEFIVQEIHRELNTMGSKCMDTEISGLVVEMKAQLERMREQIQNVE